MHHKYESEHVAKALAMVVAFRADEADVMARLVDEAAEADAQEILYAMTSWTATMLDLLAEHSGVAPEAILQGLGQAAAEAPYADPGDGR